MGPKKWGLAAVALFFAAAAWGTLRLRRYEAQKAYVESRLTMGGLPADTAGPVRQVFAIEWQSSNGERVLSTGEVRQLLAGMHSEGTAMGAAFSTLAEAAKQGQLTPAERSDVYEDGLRDVKYGDRHMRGCGAVFLRRIGGQRAIGALLPLLNDPNPMVARIAAKELNLLGYQAPPQAPK